MRPAPSYVRTVLFLIMAVLIGVLYVTLPPAAAQVVRGGSGYSACSNLDARSSPDASSNLDSHADSRHRALAERGADHAGRTAGHPRGRCAVLAGVRVPRRWALPTLRLPGYANLGLATRMLFETKPEQAIAIKLSCSLITTVVVLTNTPKLNLLAGAHRGHQGAEAGYPARDNS